MNGSFRPLWFFGFTDNQWKTLKPKIKISINVEIGKTLNRHEIMWIKSFNMGVRRGGQGGLLPPWPAKAGQK
jgi:hypothetical protein